MSVAPSEPSPTRLRERIAEEIRRLGPMKFSRYMEMCLYQPELGYYAHPREQFGKGGDFYTSSDVHAVFGRLLARQFEEMWRVLGSPDRLDLLELGSGRGLFAADVLDWSAKQFPDFMRALRYSLIEQSERSRERLQEHLSAHIEAGRARVCNSLEGAAADVGEPVIIFGNEFFDALPVEIVDHRGAVRIVESNARFAETFVPATAQELAYLDRYSTHPAEGERVELSLEGLRWMERIAQSLELRHGFVVLIDYGYTREEQLAGRHLDTLMTYRRHTAGASPYSDPGEQDITAHVNFTALRSQAERCGLDDLGLVTQTQFLLGIGEDTQFADAFRDSALPQERAKVALQLKHLISPEGMGEKFHVLLMARRVEKEQAARISGLKLAW